MPVSMATSSNIPSLKNCKKNHIPLKESSAVKTILNPNTHSCEKHFICELKRALYGIKCVLRIF